MFFVSNIKVTLDNGENVKAQTSNLSVTGLKLKISNDVHIKNDVQLSITFTGLKLEYSNNILKEKIAYKLLRQEKIDDNFSYFYLNYVDDKDEFITFINDFIKVNQHKYKIDVLYYYQIAKTIALKNSYLARMNTLPICLDVNAENAFLFTLKNKTNHSILSEWHCAEVDQLPIIFGQSRLMKYIKQSTEKYITTIYTCSHTIKGKKYFLSACEEELNEKGLKQTFINYGRSKKTWRVYHLTVTPYQFKAVNNLDITEVVPPIFDQVTHSATLQRLRISSPFSVQANADSHHVNQLIQFIHRSRIFLLRHPLHLCQKSSVRKNVIYIKVSLS
ncbi:hypothetical protein ACLKMH_16980 [Psychromonas sp. KJ10-10]|uniref:hypothetical protein n=1 Tax=Psychromonas sp. KJ10-10 TaxID=3391823 RepID=UPI0039B520B1